MELEKLLARAGEAHRKEMNRRAEILRQRYGTDVRPEPGLQTVGLGAWLEKTRKAGA
jgi:hypothetical protein